MPDKTIDPSVLQPVASPEPARESGETPVEGLMDEIVHGLDGRPWEIARVFPAPGEWIEEGDEVVELRFGDQVCVLQAGQSGLVAEVCARPGEVVPAGGMVALRLKEDFL